jgi:hypothetical protein
VTPRKLDVLIVTFSYGGNGGIASLTPYVADWLLQTVPKMTADERIGRVRKIDLCDTPITMTRNKSVKIARDAGFDLILMVDSDMYPDYYIEAQPLPDAKPFWDTSFDFLYGHYDRGAVAVAAPYCGPPPHEVVYCFCWRNCQGDHPNDVDMQLKRYTRNEAASMAGIQEAAAFPTGIVLWDVRGFELTEPKKPGDRPWFFYEWANIYQDEKGSTEDVTASREMSLAGCAQLGYNPIFVNWDAWGGHVKQKIVGKPMLLTPDAISENFRRAVTERLPSDQKRMEVRSSIADDVDWSKATRGGGLEPAESLATGNGNGDGEGVLVSHWKQFKRIVAGREVYSLGFQTPASDLRALSQLVTGLTARTDGPFRAVEIGSWVGESALTIAGAIRFKDATLTCVDTWEGTPGCETVEMLEQFGGTETVYKQFLANVAPYLNTEDGPCIRPMKLPSHEAVRTFRDNSLDFVFIDADHRYHAVCKDIENYLPKVKPGGILCGHDYNDPGHPGVKEAVLDCFPESEIIHPDETHLWVYRVPVPAPASV